MNIQRIYHNIAFDILEDVKDINKSFIEAEAKYSVIDDDIMMVFACFTGFNNYNDENDLELTVEIGEKGLQIGVSAYCNNPDFDLNALLSKIIPEIGNDFQIEEKEVSECFKLKRNVVLYNYKIIYNLNHYDNFLLSFRSIISLFNLYCEKIRKAK